MPVGPYGSGRYIDVRIVQIRFFRVDGWVLWERSVGSFAEKVEEEGGEEEDADSDTDNNAGDRAGGEVLRVLEGDCCGRGGGSAGRVGCGER